MCSNLCFQNLDFTKTSYRSGDESPSPERVRPTLVSSLAGGVSRFLLGSYSYFKSLDNNFEHILNIELMNLTSYSFLLRVSEATVAVEWSESPPEA